MFDRPRTLCLDPLPRVNQSRKYLRTFLCHRIPFCPFSSSPFLAKKDMHKSLSVPSDVDSVLRSEKSDLRFILRCPQKLIN